jgi:phage virion morphogenesis protein
MPELINVTFDDHAISLALRNFQQSVGNIRPALFEIGEYLLRTTKNRFVTKIAPDGTPWADNSPVTIEIKGRNWP